MRIDPKQQIAGISLLQIRDLLKKRKRYSSFSSIDYDVLSDEQIRAAMAWLHEQNYIEPVETKPNSWTVTELGVRFTNASALKPLKRKTAERLLQEFLMRCRYLERPESSYPRKIRKAILFGSYLDIERETINDLDIAIDIGGRYSTQKEQFENEVKFLKENHRRELEFLDNALISFLMNKCGYYQVTSIYDSVLEKDIPKKLIYEGCDLTIEVPEYLKTDDELIGYRLGYGDAQDGEFTLDFKKTFTYLISKGFFPLGKAEWEIAKNEVQCNKIAPKMKAYSIGFCDAKINLD